MATYRVTPLPDGIDQRYGWQVKKAGRRVSSHYKKSGALSRAKREASSSDSIVIHNLQGQVLRSISG